MTCIFELVLTSKYLSVLCRKSFVTSLYLSLHLISHFFACQFNFLKFMNWYFLSALPVQSQFYPPPFRLKFHYGFQSSNLTFFCLIIVLHVHHTCFASEPFTVICQDTHLVLVTCPAAVGVEKVNVLNFAFALRKLKQN